MKTIVICIILAFTSVTYAQNQDLGGGAEGSARNFIGQQWKVVVNVAYIFSGPSSAYRKLGQAYQDEMLQILDTTPSQEWVKVLSSNGIRGWVLTNKLERPRRALTPGRYRRQNNYQYDAQGNRIQPNGQAVGQGQKNDPRFNQQQYQQRNQQQRNQQQYQQQRNQQQYQQQRNQQQYQQGNQQQYQQGNQQYQAYKPQKNDWHSYKLMLSISPLGMNKIYRKFASDLLPPSPLVGFESNATTYQYQLDILYKVHRYFHIQTAFFNTAAGKTNLPAHPLYPALPTVELEASQMQAEFHLQGGYDFKSIWAGLQVGAHYFDQSYQNVPYPAPYQNYATLQNHQLISLSVGSSIKFEMNRLRLHGDFSLLLPLSFEQTPLSEGQWDGLAWRAHLKASVVLTHMIALSMYGRYMRFGVEYTGPAAYSDPFDKSTRYYTQANMMESGLGTGLSVDLTF